MSDPLAFLRERLAEMRVRVEKPISGPWLAKHAAKRDDLKALLDVVEGMIDGHLSGPDLGGLIRFECERCTYPWPCPTIQRAAKAMGWEEAK